MANTDQTAPGMEQQNGEINDVKEKYAGQCKVIHDVGDFTNVVVIRPEAIDIVIKFQLTASYPSEKPAVIVRSESIAVDSMPEIMELVNKTTTDNAKGAVMELVVESVLRYLRDNGLDTPPEPETHNKKKGKGSASKAKKKAKKNNQEKDESALDVKKPSMKTAEDVIKRIMWDESLPTDLFVVGYLDRFMGIMEKAFTAFSWEDLASVDYDVLAIPKHRIQYFKYKDVIVWDKIKRNDYIFGSVGKGVSIHDVMEHYDEYYSAQKEKAGANDKRSPKYDNEDDDDDDDDIEIDFGCSSGATNDHPDDDDTRRPNHFFCVRITDGEIIEGIEVVQDSILENEPRYASCCIRPTALHLTLCTVGLDSDEQRTRAAKVLQDSRKELLTLARAGTELRLEGVENFYNRVIYARVHHDMAFREFVDRFRKLLEEHGVEIRDNYGYVPHVTIMKTTRPVSRELSTPKVNPDLYNHFSDMYFGKQNVEGIYLCEMNDQRRPDGFYVTHASISVEDRN